MMGLLSWLYSVQQRVYNIFGGIYQSVVNAAQYAWNWAVGEANDAFNRAINWANTVINNTSSYLQGLINSVRSYAQWVYGIIWTAVDETESWLVSYFNVLLGNARADLTNLINSILPQAINFAQNLIGSITTALTGLINQLRSEVANGSIFTGDLKAALDFLQQASNLTAIQGLIGLFTTLVAFFTNPVGFILEQAKAIAQEFLCWVFAYGLGTIKYDLPPWPVWYTPSGGIIAPPAPGAAASGLVPPLSRLWVSGYTFNNPPGHMGVDFGPTDPFVVYAAHDGTVTYAAWSTVGYGNTITLQGSRWWTRYGHLQSFRVGVGESVKAGQVIAIGDTTGNSTGNHLHFELKDNGTFVNPLLYF